MTGNKLIRISGLLLVLTLVTFCFVGGTFAKYVTTGKAEDTARVAKWGVVLTGTGDAFAKEYAADDKTGGLGVSVKSDVPVIAPGTSGTFKGFTLSGTPEVALKIETDVTVTMTGNWVIGEDFYCPLIFTINGVKFSGLEYDSQEAFIAELKAKLESASNTGANHIAPGVDLANPGSNDHVPVLFQPNKIIWQWAFVDGHKLTSTWEVTQTDEKDTELGNRAANDPEAPTISIQFDVTITQVD